jgi:hypothetical protein
MSTNNDVPSEVNEAVDLLAEYANICYPHNSGGILIDHNEFRDYARCAFDLNWNDGTCFAEILTAANTIQNYYNERAGYDAAAQAMKEQIEL